MNQNFVLLIRIIFIFLDLMMLNITYFSVKLYLLGAPYPSDNKEYLFLWIFANLCWLGCAWSYSLYHGRYTNKLDPFIRRTLHTYLIFLILILIYLYFSRQLYISRIFASSFLLIFPFLLLVNRMFYLLAAMHFRKKETLIKRVMIIGYNDIGKKLAAYFERNDSRMKVVGFCEEDEKVFELSNYPILNRPINAVETSQQLQVSEIYSTILPEQDKRIYQLMQHADQVCIRFKLVPDFGLFVNRPMHLNYLSGMAVLSPRTEPLDDLVNRIKKRIFDIAFSSLMILFVLSWLIPLVALCIWLENRGPIFFIQKRSGINNKPFWCIKFRSMRDNKEAHSVQASKRDDRITRVGHFIRKTSIDEFPQFFNVLKGDMSIVGPRPHMIKHTQDYSAVISHYMVRQMIKPGITGWAQINGFRGEIHSTENMQSRVDHDLWYIENWNMLLDLRVIILTGYNLIKGEKNAY
jgi:putative colanic acid biosynthesis UDP-glucose lipid carrier transferase